jgi:hypothetical protein
MKHRRPLDLVTMYVNPYTRELVRVEAHGADWDRLMRETLPNQGVTQKGAWTKEDFRNWGVVAIRKWDFDSFAKNARFMKHLL